MAEPWRVSVGRSTYRRLSAQLAVFFARRICGGIDPNELVTDVWIAAGRYYANKSTLRHYLFTVARSVLGEHKRQQRRQLSVISLEELQPRQSASFEGLPDVRTGHETLQILRSNREVIREALEKIGDPYQEVVRLWLDGLDSIQIADDLDLHYNTVRSRLSRGRRQLERQLRRMVDLPA